ncbi:MAG: tetratricopeptide repeat protein [Candidatus Marinimicrobia bacterium]|jgi:tetratricopeptide (TPR) repeat protein|nr:tetratricopeptide repeat protein [Candidatus Neomarinimicrobiota bacterium]
MLKPRKKTTRKEIKKDPVLEKVANTYGFVQDKQKILIRIGIGIAIGFILINIWKNHVRKNTEESSTILTKALVSWQSGDVDNAQLHFETLADEFKSTTNGKIANYWLGMIAYNNGNSESATDYLKQFIKFGKADILLPNAYRLLANLSVDGGNVEKAHSYFKKAVKYSSGENDRMVNELNLVEFYLSQDRLVEAKAILLPIMDTKDLSSSLKTRAEELTGKL